jgi:hypothetical protein
MSVGFVIVLVLEGLAIQVLLVLLLQLRRRHTALGREVAAMLAMHQDLLASCDARLRALGSRTAGDQPVPTAAEVMGGQWQR